MKNAEWNANDEWAGQAVGKGEVVLALEEEMAAGRVAAPGDPPSREATARQAGAVRFSMHEFPGEFSSWPSPRFLNRLAFASSGGTMADNTAPGVKSEPREESK